MSHDMNLDEGIFIDERSPDLEKILKLDNFTLTKRSKLLTGELIEETYKYRTAKIDIFYVYKKR